CQMKTGDTKSAQQSFNKIVMKNPDYSHAYYNLGIALSAMPGREGDAAKMWSKCREYCLSDQSAGPEQLDPYQCAIVLIASGNEKKGLDDLRLFLDQRERLGLTGLQLVNALGDAELMKPRIKCMEQAVQLLSEAADRLRDLEQPTDSGP